MRHIYLFVIFAVLCNMSFSQDEKSSKDIFYMDALNFYSPDSTKTRVDVYVEVPFKNMEFKKVKGENTYSSNFDLTIEFTDIKNAIAFNKVYKETLITPKTDIEYLAQNSSILIKNIYMSPGQYKLKVTIYEPGTQIVSEKTKDIAVRDFLASPVTVSDIMIVSKIDDDKDRKRITPLVSRNVNDLDTFYLFFFVYKNSDDSKIDVNYKISNSQNAEVYKGSEALDITTGIDIQNQMLIPIPLNNLTFDNYKIDITATSTQGSASSSSSIESRNSDFPMSLNNIEELTAQLQYIAKEKEIKYINSGKTDAEKQQRFIEFWKSKDPSPNTKKNEIMTEYYKRIKYANKNFSTVFDKGWKSDMGMVYVIYGMPNNIERHPYEMDVKPYEIWDYYDYNRQFVFVDSLGFGDYRLISPIWDTFRYK